jgi:3',5'-cyclic AMP phosphodiesterase CpdA
MKIAVASDLHLEFGDLYFDNSDHADVLILSGDICVAADIGRPDPHGILESARSNRIVDFFKRCSFQFPHVIYILGNHEHYHGDFATTHNIIKSMLESNFLSNVYLLDNEIKQIDDVTFIGGTLWTDMNREDPITLYHMKSMMNDFRCVRNTTLGTNVRFFPEDAVEEHVKMKQYIQSVVQGNHDTKYVGVGHHSPSRQSTHEMYAHDTVMNGGYSSDLDEFVTDHPQIKLWTHGHTHHEFDYMIGETRVMCNPRGYAGYEQQAEQWQLKTVDI